MFRRFFANGFPTKPRRAYKSMAYKIVATTHVAWSYYIRVMATCRPGLIKAVLLRGVSAYRSANGFPTHEIKGTEIGRHAAGRAIDGQLLLQESRFELAGVEIDPAALRIHRDNQVERVEPKTMQVLLALVR